MIPTDNPLQLYGLWIQSGAIFISFVGVIVTLFWNRSIAKRRATLDMLLAEEAGERAQTRSEFVALQAKGRLVQWLAPEHIDGPEIAIIRATLNQYELISIGIFQRTIDRKMYKRWARSTVVGDWILLKPFVMQLRHDADRHTYFCEFEELAKCWANKAERLRV